MVGTAANETQTVNAHRARVREIRFSAFEMGVGINTCRMHGLLTLSCIYVPLFKRKTY
jgi:hypothetical protein